MHSFDIRLDHQFSENSNLFARDSFQNTDAFSPSLFGPPLGGTLEGAGTTSARNQNAGIGYTYAIGPTLLNEIRIGLNRQTTSLTQEDYGQNLSQQFGIPGVNVSPQTSGFRIWMWPDFSTSATACLLRFNWTPRSWNFSEKATWVKGRHVMRLGFDYQYGMGSTGYLVYGRG